MPKVLIIEDEPSVRLNIVELLEAEGFEVLEAADGRDGLNLIYRGQPDLVVCDIRLPELDGFEVLEHLRRSPKFATLPFIFLTACTERSDQRRGMDLGADDYITKPCTAEELRGAIWSRLQRRKHYEVELDQAKAQLEQALYSDRLTQLPNRLSLRDQFQTFSRTAQATGHCVNILCIGIDRFNRINEALGYHLGDLVLQYTAKTLQDSLEPGDFLARITGDQFIALLDRPDHEAGYSAAEQCLQQMMVPMVLEDREIFGAGSIGIVTYPQHGKNIDSLIKRANGAMQRAKRQGGNRICVYDAQLDNVTLDKFSLEADLRQAIDQEKLQVYYQPRINLKTGKIVGAEALLRWFHPTRGFISPSIFIPLAEEIDLIGTIDEWVLRQACQQIRQWQLEQLPLITVSVNLSARQFNQPNLDHRILSILAAADLDPDWLEMEITESSLVQAPESAAQVLQQLRTIGIRIALDDFGTGYSSLSYLQQFPLDTLKIDQSFIRNIGRSSRSVAITLATLRMAKDLRLAVVAEGVETEDDLLFLCHHNCDSIQGYLFSPPVPPDQLRAMLQAKRSLKLPTIGPNPQSFAP